MIALLAALFVGAMTALAQGTSPSTTTTYIPQGQNMTWTAEQDTALRSSFENFEKAQRAMKSMSPLPSGKEPGPLDSTSTPCTYCAGPTVPWGERVSCLKNICKGSHQSIHEIDKKSYSAEETPDMKELKKVYETVFEKYWAKEEKRFDLMAQVLENNRNFSPSERIQLNLYYAVFKGAYLSSNLEPAAGVKLNVKVPLEGQSALHDLAPADLKFVAEINEDVRNRLLADLMSLAVYPADLVLRVKHPKTDTLTAYRKELADTEVLFKKAAEDPDFAKKAALFGLQDDLDTFKPEDLKINHAPGPEQVRKLLLSRSLIGFYQELNDPNSVLSKKARNFDSTHLTSAKYREDRAVAWKAYAKTMRAPDIKETRKRLFVSRCLADYGVNTIVLPSKKEIASFQARSTDVFNRVRKNVLSKFSKLSSESAGKELDKVELLFPPTRNEYIADFKHRTAQMELEADRPDTDSNRVIEMRALTDTSSFSDLLDKRDCKPEAYPMLSDAAYSRNDGLRVSWGSVRDPELGSRVLAHELGHKIGNVFEKTAMSEGSAKSFAEVRSCLTFKHSVNLKEKKLSFAGTGPSRLQELKYHEGQYTEEDFADWVAAEAFSDASGNPWCAFIPGGSELAAQPSMHSLSIDDPHSSALFRVIQLEMHQKGRLPPGCKKIVDEELPFYMNSPRCEIKAEESKPRD